MGFLSALLGIGGGALIIPVMVLIFGYPMHTAIATSLIVIIATSNSAAAINVIKGLVNVRLAIFLEMITAATAILGGVISTNLPEKPLMVGFSVFLIIMAGLYYKGSKTDADNTESNTNSEGIFEETYYDRSINEYVSYKVSNIHTTTLVSGFAGLISGSMGLGGGIFKVPAMNGISKVPMKASAATSNFMIGLTAAAGASIYFKSGFVEPMASCMMVVGVIIGSNISARYFGKLKDATIKHIFLIFIVIVAVQMLIKSVKM